MRYRAKPEKLDYEPRFQHETEQANQNRDPVRTNMSDGRPTNDPDPWRWLDPSYQPGSAKRSPGA